MTLLMRDQENFRAGKAEAIILLGTEFGLLREEILKKIIEQTGVEPEQALEYYEIYHNEQLE